MATKRRKSRKVGERAGVDLDGLLDIACDVMTKSGFYGMSFQSIADRAGVSQTTIFHYFKDRSTLVRMIILYCVRSNRAFVEALEGPDATPLDRIRKHFRGNFAWARHRPDQASVLLLLYYLGSVHPEQAAFYGEILVRARRRIYDLLVEANAEGMLRAELDLGEMAELLHDLLVGGFVNRMATRSIEDAEAGLIAKLLRVLDPALR